MQISSHKRGFTLIEMLVVVSIIGILLAISGQQNNMALLRAKDVSVKMELNTLRNAVYQYSLNNNGNFPDELSMIVPDHISSIPSAWQGSKASGVYFYDSKIGTVLLKNAEGNEVNYADAKGILYADY